MSLHLVGAGESNFVSKYVSTCLTSTKYFLEGAVKKKVVMQNVKIWEMTGHPACVNPNLERWVGGVRDDESYFCDVTR